MRYSDRWHPWRNLCDEVSARAGSRDPRELLHHVLDHAHEHRPWGADAIRPCLIVLAAVADRHEPTRTILWTLLDDQRLTTRITATVIQTAINHAPPTTCQTIENALPHYRTDLIQAAAALTTHILTTLPPTTPPATRARYLNNLGNRLSQAGDKQAALTPAREAVQHYRALAEADPAAYLPNLAGSLWAFAAGQAHESGPQSSALEEALDAAENACHLYENLTQSWPKGFEGHLQAARATLTTVTQLLEREQARDKA